MEAPGDGSLGTLLHVFSDGLLQPAAVQEVYQSEGSDTTLCCEALLRAPCQSRGPQRRDTACADAAPHALRSRAGGPSGCEDGVNLRARCSAR